MRSSFSRSLSLRWYVGLAVCALTTPAAAQAYRQAQPRPQTAPQPVAHASYPAPAAAGRVTPVQFEQAAPAQTVPQAAASLAPPAGQQTALPVGAAPTGAGQPAFRVAETPTPPPGAGQSPEAAQPGEHPLMPALRWAKQGLDSISQAQDYSCTLVKRERIDGTLGEHEYLFVKVRHHPFSVYTYFLGPARVKGQEAVYVEGQNSGSMLAHGNGIKHRLIGTVSLKPTSPLAMSGNRYPITEMGLRRLLERLLEIGTNDLKYGECTVNYIQGAKVNNRTCTCIQVVHPHPRRNFLFHLARIYVDDEAQLPIRYEAYDWPAHPGEQPQLTEEYTFLNVKLNNGFTDADFSTENPSYGFR